ncbi:MAG TPA: M14 family zinc carboxypeptidase [Xanthomonadaceae bacterium]|nr:M14 family zinc carboxypeptidase [Xanthomonadaceae bacterium]
MRRLAALLGLWLLTSCVAAAHDGDALILRAALHDAAALQPFAARFGHVQVDEPRAQIRFEGDRGLLKDMRNAGLQVDIDTLATADMQRALDALAPSTRAINGFACYRTVEETLADIEALRQAHPNLLSTTDIGHSWQQETGGNGYPIRVVRVTNHARFGAKPKLMLLASIHAREYTPAELTTRFVEHLVLGYGSDPDATWILDHHEVHAVLQGNPDGRKRAEAGQSWRKNVNDDQCTGSGAGIDLNRNYPFEWGQHGGSSGAPCDFTYRGPYSASEPEASAVVDYVRDRFPDMRGPGLDDPAPDDTQGMFIDIHSFSRLVLWPWGFATSPAPNGSALGLLGRRLAWFNDYQPKQAVALYPTDGTTMDFAYGELGLPAYTFELGNAFFESCTSFESSILPDNLHALKYAASVLRAPYLLPAGPSALEVSAEPDLAIRGEPLTIRARIDDTRYSQWTGSGAPPLGPVLDIASAHAWPGTPPWENDAVSVPMQAVDGAFDQTIEEVVVTLDTQALPSGRQLVWVQGRDVAGQDGPPAAAFFETIEADQAVIVSGLVRQAVTGTPLAAELAFGRFTAASDPVQGQYQRLLPAGSWDIEVRAIGHEVLVLDGYALEAGVHAGLDFDLTPLCRAIDDPVTLDGPTPFTAQPPWNRRAGAGQDGTAAWIAATGAQYGNGLDVSLTSGALDLGNLDQPRLRFDQRCATESGYDFGRIEISLDSGAWQEVFRCSGDYAWRAMSIELPQLAGATDARLRFRFTSDHVITAPGWALQNIVLEARGEHCAAAPVEVFSSGFED